MQGTGQTCRFSGKKTARLEAIPPRYRGAVLFFGLMYFLPLRQEIQDDFGSDLRHSAVRRRLPNGSAALIVCGSASRWRVFRHRVGCRFVDPCVSACSGGVSAPGKLAFTQEAPGGNHRGVVPDCIAGLSHLPPIILPG